MILHLRFRLLAAALAALAFAVVACGPATPPAQSAAAVSHDVLASSASRAIAAPPPSDAEARRRLLYPYNLPRYDDELERAMRTTPDASSRSQ